MLVEAGKPDIHLDYRLKKVKGLWYIVDVNVEGIWLVDNYRNQFAGIVNSSGIEGLIAELEKKNAGAEGMRLFEKSMTLATVATLKKEGIRAIRA